MDVLKNAGHGENIFARRTLLAAALLGMIVLAGCVSTASGGPQQGIGDKFRQWWGPWFLPMAASFGIGIAIVAIAWMYASIAMDDKLKAWVKSEVVQLGYSAVILMAAALIISSLANISAALPAYTPLAGQDGLAWSQYVNLRCAVDVEPSRPCHIRIAEDYLEILASATQGQATAALRYSNFLYVVSSMGIGVRGIPAPGGAVPITPFAGLTPVIETLGFVFDLLMKNLMVLRAQQFVIDFFHLAFFPFFFCAGIFFRAFYFTRKLGGLLIALALSFYIVFPMMYIFFNSVLFSFTGPWVNALPQEIGTNMIRTDINYNNVNTGVVRPVEGSPTYQEDIPLEYADNPNYWGETVGSSCGNGSIEPWEECNEYDNALNSDTGEGHEGSFTCPPKDSEGNIIGGREKDTYCDTNSCKCTSNYYAGLSGNFRNDFLDGGITEEDRLDEAASMAAQMCFENSIDTTQAGWEEDVKREESFLEAAKKNWWEKLLDGYGGGIMRALATDALLGENGTIDNAAKLLIFSLLVPFISLMVALGAIKVLSPSLGGDVEIAGLTRLI